MAQAPKDEAAPRKTTTYNKFEGMESQNERYNVKQNEMFWIENIMRTGPRKLSSVPGPTFRRFYPTIGCTDSTERGQQHLTAVTAFAQNGEVPGGSLNNRTSWAFVDSTGRVLTLNGDPGCGGGNMFYLDTCVQLNQFFDNVSVVHDHPALVPPLGGNAVNTLIGIADQQAYGSADNSFGPHGPLRVWWFDENSAVTYLAPGGFGSMQVVDWCAKGDELWTFINQTSFSPPRTLVRYNRLSGVSTGNFNTLQNDYVNQMSLTATYLNALTFDVSNVANCALKRINRSDGSLHDTIDLSNLLPSFAFGVNDSLIYILCAANFPANAAKMYYWNGTDIVFVGIVNSYPNNPFYNGCGQFSGGRFYFGRNGFGGFTVDIFSIAISCPPQGGAPTIATVTRDLNTVARGNAINVSWHDVLEPQQFLPFKDRIVLYPKPAAGKLDFIVSTAVAEKETDGSHSSTMAFTIPGGTTPGDYVFRYQMARTVDAILVATSDPFTVT